MREVEGRKMNQKLTDSLSKEFQDGLKLTLIEMRTLKMVLIWVGLRINLIEMEERKMGQNLRNSFAEEFQEGWKSKLIEVTILQMLLIWVGLRLRLNLIDMSFWKMFLISVRLRWRSIFNLIEMEFIEMSQKGFLSFNCSSNSFPYTFRLRQSKLRISSRMGILRFVHRMIPSLNVLWAQVPWTGLSSRFHISDHCPYHHRRWPWG
jgi:hypothetical protein